MTSEHVEIEVLGGEAAQRRWPEISRAIRDAFAGARFNDGCDVRRPLDDTEEGMAEQQWPRLCHVVALDRDGAIVGAWFRIPFRRSTGEVGCHPGWFFTANGLGASTRLRVADAMVDRAHEVIRAAGYERIVCNMGTAAGAKFLQRRHGYLHQPTPELDNRWLKIL